jgi:uncharacterized protein (TIGR02145 family)
MITLAGDTIYNKIFRKRKMQPKQIRLLTITLFWLGLTGCHPGCIKDFEGNRYKTVAIGTQRWMAENLKSTRYNDGTLIPEVRDNDTWAKLTTPGYSWYNNDSIENKKTFGAIYNWYTINTDKLCPTGWHIPTDSEWHTMLASFDDSNLAGGKLKEAGTTHWKIPNNGATNKSGFTALPGGYRSIEGIFNFIGISGYWWTSTEYDNSSAFFYNLRYKYSLAYKYRSEKFCGFSVRCVKDQ